jgi:hypothetical protein
MLRPLLLTVLFVCTAPVVACAPSFDVGDDDNDDDDDDDDDDNDDPINAAFAFESGAYTPDAEFYTRNDCGLDVPVLGETITLEVDDDRVHVAEWNVTGEFDGEELVIERRFVERFDDQGFACVLDIDVELTATLVRDNEFEFEARIDLLTIAGEPDEECVEAADLFYGADGFDEITGCASIGEGILAK